MSLRIRLLLASLALAGSVAAQELVPLFPSASQAKAAKLIGAIDKASKLIEAKRQAAWEAELAAETEAVQAYALIAASRSGRGPWASPDGSAKAADASLSLSAAHSRAKAAALSLASGEDGSAAYFKARDEAGKSLASLIRSSGMSAKSASLLEKRLAAKAKADSLFPEIAEIAELLRKAGGNGSREAAAAAGRGSAEGMALSLIESKARILALAPGTEGPLSRLEVLSRAYRSWLEAFPAAAYPGEPSSPSDLGMAAASSAIVLLSSPGSERLRALFDSMAKGDGRDAAAAHAARSLAEIWLTSPEPRRRALDSLYGLPESTMALFCFALSAREHRRALPPTLDPIANMRALNILAAGMAGEAENGGNAKGADYSLLFLERPELASLARVEPRYASLYAEASRRLDAIYARAAEEASARLETAATLIGAAARALGSAPVGLSVRAVDLRSVSGGSGRRLAFEAAATDASGYSINLPVDAEAAGRVYAAAFAKAAGIEPAKANPAALLAKYGQLVLSAYDPSGSDNSLDIDSYPSEGVDGKYLSSIDLELALLGGWRP